MVDQRAPVNETPFSQEGHSLQTIMLSAELGLMTAIADSQRPVNACKVLNNLQMTTRRGIWQSRGIGFTNINAVAFNSGAKFMDFAIYYDALGAQTLLAQVGDRVGTISADLQTFTALPAPLASGLSTSLYPCMRMFSPSSSTTQPMLVYTNGAIEPQKITGAVGAAPGTVATLTGWPITFNAKQYTKPKFCEPFGQRMVYSGFANTGTAANQIVCDILFSDLGNAETYTTSTPQKVTDAVAFTYPAILGPLRGMHSFKLTNQTNDEVMLFGCQNGMFIITGNDPTNYQLRVLTKEHGLVNNRNWAQARNDLIYFSNFGFRSFSSLNQNANLVNDQLSLLIKDLVNNIDLANATGSHCFQNSATQEIQFWSPQSFDTGANSHGFVLNYNNDASNSDSISPVWSTRDGVTIEASIVFNGICYGGLSGFIQQHYNGDTYNGTPIHFDLVGALCGLGNLTQTHRCHRVIVATEGGSQSFSMNSYFYEHMEEGGIQRVLGEPSQYPLAAGVLNTTTLGTWILGVSAFPSNHIKTLEYDPAGHGIFSEYEIFSSTSTDALDYAGMQVIISGGSPER